MNMKTLSSAIAGASLVTLLSFSSAAPAISAESNSQPSSAADIDGPSYAWTVNDEKTGFDLNVSEATLKAVSDGSVGIYNSSGEELLETLPDTIVDGDGNEVAV